MGQLCMFMLEVVQGVVQDMEQGVDMCSLCTGSCSSTDLR